jgi:type I restriction enzyme R subunit
VRRTRKQIPSSSSYKNIRAGFDGNLRDYLDEHVIAHAFDHKDFGLIVDYNGMLKSLRAALAQYALGDEGGGAEEIVAPIEERVKALLAAIEETEAHLLKIGFDATRMIGAKGFTRIAAIADGVEAVISARDEGRRRFEIMARQVFVRFKALVMEPAAFTYAERHDNIEAIYKKLEERRDTADVTEVLKALHRIVNEAIRAQDDPSRSVEEDSPSRLYDLSQVDFAKLRDEFAKKVKRKATAIEDMRKIVEEKLAQMLARNPQRMK